MLLDIRPDHLALVQGVLQRWVADKEVWAFGSRAKWTAKDYSDLDLCIVTQAPLPFEVMGHLQEDFAESDLPYKVDLVDWSSVSAAFRTVIERDKVVVQRPQKAGAGGWGVSSDWQETTLGAVTAWMSGGTPKKDEPVYWGGDIPWISANSMHGTRYTDSDLKLTEKGLANGSRLAPKDAVLLLVRGGALHTRIPVGIAERPVAFNQDVKAIVSKEDRIRPWFLLSWLMGYEQYLLNSVVEYTGIGAGKLDTKRMQSLKMLLPPLDEQDEIVTVAKALDDRITLLRETNATLEAIAQALFKSWFVDFDPVRAKMEGRVPEGMDEATAALFPDALVESELGLVPEGWRVGVLGDVAQTNRKQLQPSDLHEGLHYVGLEHIPRKSLSLTDWGTADGLESAKAAFSAGDILFGKLRPYFHKVVVAPFDGVCSTDILVCQATLPCNYGFVAMQLFSVALIGYAERLSNGAKMPRVGWKDLAAYPIVVPVESVAMEYTKAIEPLLVRMKANVHEVQTLAALRDTLLPRLISGQLQLPELAAELP